MSNASYDACSRCVDNDYGVSVSHKSERRLHDTHGHITTTSPQHGGEREEEEKERITDKTGIFLYVAVLYLYIE